MVATNVSHKVSFFLALALLLVLTLLTACGGGPSSPTPVVAKSTNGPATPQSIVPTSSPPDEGVAATIPAGSQPDITVESGSAKLLTFIGADTTDISTNLYALPYKKKGEPDHHQLWAGDQPGA